MAPADSLRVRLARLTHRVRLRFDREACVDFEVQQWCDRVDALLRRAARPGLTIAEWRELRRLRGEDGPQDVAAAVIDDDDLLGRFLELLRLPADHRRVALRLIDAFLADQGCERVALPDKR